MSAEHSPFHDATKIAQRLLGKETTESEARLALAMGLGQLSKLEKDLKEKNNQYKPKSPLLRLIERVRSL